MKKKYKIQVFLTCCIVSSIWGLLGSYIVIKNPDNELLAGGISAALYFISLAIPVRMISNRARKDLDDTKQA